MSFSPMMFRAARRPLALALALAPTLAACHDARASADQAVETEGSTKKQEPAERCPVNPRPASLGPVAAGAADSTVRPATPGDSTVASAAGDTTRPAPKPTRADSARDALRARWAKLDSLPRLAGSILPGCRVIAYYGNPLSKRMGVLGEYPSEQMLGMLDKEIVRWQAADSSVKVIPALHLIVVVAQGSPGRDGKYRLRMADTLIDRVAQWAATRDALLFLDVQVALSTLQEELPRLERYLKRPNVHLGIDPEFSMKDGTLPGKKIGTYDAKDINYAIGLLGDLVTRDSLPPKMLVVHRFTRNMVTNSAKIRTDPRVQVVIDMDGWGGIQLKRDSYRHYVASEPVQFTGFKLFYHNDQKKPGTRVMTPQEVLQLEPKPMYIQYQ